MEIKHVLDCAFLDWKTNNLTQELKEKALASLEPVVQSLVDKKTLTDEEKINLKKNSETINDLIDKHFNVINTKRVS